MSLEYRIKWEKRAVSELKKLEREVQRRIIKEVDKLKGEPFRGKLLTNRYRGLRRIRVGDYRVIYAVNRKNNEILILRIGHRREIYRS